MSIIDIRFDHMQLYNNILPKFYDELVNLDKNPYFCNDLTSNIYNKIISLDAKICNQINTIMFPDISFNNNDKFFTGCVDYNGKFDVNIFYNFDKETLPFYVVINKNGIICQLIDPNTLNNKLNFYTGRYLPYELIFIDPIIKQTHSAHSILLIFDKLERIIYVFDPNGNFGYFDEIMSNLADKININITSKFESLFFKLLTQYASMIDFYFDPLTSNISVNLNKKITSECQKSFFQGYCRPWILFLQNILLKSPIEFDIKDLINILTAIDDNVANEIIEIFQVYFYNKYINIFVN